MRIAVLESLLSFCVGVSWVAAIFLSIAGFLYTYTLGLFFGIVSAVICFIIGISLVLFFEGINLILEILKEQQKQTKLLEKLTTNGSDQLSNN